MNFKLGILLGTFLLIKLELIVIALIYIFAIFFPLINILLNIIATALMIIIFLGHIKTTFILFRKIFALSFNIEEKEDNFLNGVKVRCKEEWSQIKKVSNFNFKLND